MTRASVYFFAILASVFVLLGGTPQRAFACTIADFGRVVDETAQALRELNASGAQRFQAKLKSFQQKHNLSEDEIQARAATIQDDKMSEFNREIEGLVAQMDGLSQTPNENINCEKLDELKRVRDRLLTVMGQKSGYMLAKADVALDNPAPPKGKGEAGPQHREVAGGPLPTLPDAGAKPMNKGDRLAQKQPEARPNVEAAKPETGPITEPKPAGPAPQANASAPLPAAPKPLNPDMPERRPANSQVAHNNWQTDSQTVSPPPMTDVERERQFAAQSNGKEPTRLLPPPDGQLPPPQQPVDTTYSIEEISDAGRGIFGTVTAQFAAAINYAFQQFGRPNAYITGSEGGAALLAGLRYGNGTLHSKIEPERPIYWQGPSLGYDLGAEGSNALFLVYNLDEPEKIFGRFTGVGGSAYVAGGVGLNVLGKGGMVMVPIRTGIGLRIGANLAYLKFTERQTWNPF